MSSLHMEHTLTPNCLFSPKLLLSIAEPNDCKADVSHHCGSSKNGVCTTLTQHRFYSQEWFRITDYPDLERTHKNHKVWLLRLGLPWTELENCYQWGTRCRTGGSLLSNIFLLTPESRILDNHEKQVFLKRLKFSVFFPSLCPVP